MVFCNVIKHENRKKGVIVTILILIDGFLQCDDMVLGLNEETSQSLF